MAILWLTAVLDVPETAFERDCRFWQGVTATAALQEETVATLVPDAGDAYLRMRPVATTEGGCHLEIHTEEPVTQARTVLERGGRPEQVTPELIRATSPGGLRFDLVKLRGDRRRPSPRLWPQGQRSLVDQLCIDIPSSAFSDECDFWAALTGWEQRPGGPGFRYLPRPVGMPLRLLLQQVDDPRSGPVRSHLDLACSDVAAECRRHVGLGASVAYEGRVWTTLRDRAGIHYCITRRDPDTGVL